MGPDAKKGAGGWVPLGCLAPSCRLPREKQNHQAPRLLTVANLASGVACYGGPISTSLCAEIRTRLKMTEAESERTLRQFRSLPVDHPDRGVLVRRSR